MLSAATCIVAAVLLAAVGGSVGCRKGGKEGGAPSEAARVPPYPAGLSAQSSPEEVVRVLIRALEEEDELTLQGLVAVKAEVEAVKGIYSKYGRKSELGPAEVASITAAGWALTYGFFQPGQTAIESAEVQGDTARVFLAGKRGDGKPASLKVELLREDGLWKVRAGLKSTDR